MITSTGNQQMKYIMQLQKKSKTRYDQRVFVVEGPKMTFEAPKEWVEKVYVSETFAAEPENIVKLKDYEYEIVADSVLKAVSDTQTPQGILVVVRRQDIRPEIIWQQPGALIMVLERIQDPGNLGTIVRTAEGAGVTGIILSADTVDIYNSKVIRSTMGSIYRMPFAYVADVKQAVKAMKADGIRTYAAHLSGQNSYDREDYTAPTAFLIGNEGNGLTDELTALSDSYIRIPMCGQVESLNAAIASAILRYEAIRQRRQ